MNEIKIWAGELPGYKLLDSGEKQKLEEINGVKIVRAEPRAWWKTSLSGDEYKVLREKQKDLETVLDIGIGGLPAQAGVKAKIKYKEGLKHIGIFPEQAGQWRFIKEKIERWKDGKIDEKRELKILNLFGYTGIASLVAASAGLDLRQGFGHTTKVTHVDASKQSVDWARENQKLSGLESAPIRWIVDDVLKFLKREIKRGERYDAIIMDPPSYGRGPKGEVWKIEDKLPQLLDLCRQVLSDNPQFIIFNMYSTELSSISVSNLLADLTRGFGGKTECGELAIKENGSERLLPMSICAIWEK